MKKYMIPVDVTSVTGTQTFSVMAKSPKEALTIFHKKGGNFEYEDIDVEDLATDNINVNDLWEHDSEVTVL